MGEIIFAPSDFRASVISLSSVIANVSYTWPGSPGMSVPRESATAFSAYARNSDAVPVSTKTFPSRRAM